MATIEFIPRRLNNAPVVYKGMTFFEIVVVASIGLVVFLIPGVISAFVLSSIAMVPTVMFAGSGATVFFGGKIMQRLRRGRSPITFYRQLEWKITKSVFRLNQELIVSSGTYKVRRDKDEFMRGKNK